MAIRKRPGQLFDTSGLEPTKLTDDSWQVPQRSVTPTNVRAVGGDQDQLEMFKTARAIKEQYAPAEGDRLYTGTDVYVHGAVGPKFEALFKVTRGGPPAKETNDELMGRKGREAELTPQEWHEHKKKLLLTNKMILPEQVSLLKPIPQGHTQSLAEHLRSGGDPGIIPLGRRSSVHNTSDPRPMLAGAHHRVEVLSQSAPDKLLPVEHYENVRDYKYVPDTRPGRKGQMRERPGYQ